MFGLPLSTTFVAFGIPILIILGLIWWGIRFPGEDNDNPGVSEESKP